MNRPSLALTLWLCACSLAGADDAPPADEPPPAAASEEEPAAGWSFDPREGLLYQRESLRLRPRALVAADYRRYDARNTRRRDVRLDRALIGFEAEALGGLSLRVLGDLRGTDTRYGLEEAWAAYELGGETARVRLRAGLLRFTPGVEHALPEETLPWIDYGAPAQLTGRHDLGLSLEGELLEGLASWQLGLGFGEGFDLYGQRRSDPFLLAKVMVYPLRWLEGSLDLGPYRFPLSGLFFSAGAVLSRDFLGYLDSGTALRNKLFDSSRLRARRTFAWHVAWGIDLGPIRVVHELGRFDLLDLRLPGGGRDDFQGNQLTAWSLGISWRITGEPYDSRSYRQVLPPRGGPRRPLAGPGSDEARRGSVDLEVREGSRLGLIEVAFRFMNSERDREFFLTGLTDFRRSSQEWRALDLALNWYPVRSLRLSFHLTRTIADTARPGGSGVASPGVFPESKHARDTSFLVRLQLDF